MYDLLPMLALGFVIGLSGALAPGPTLVATIKASLSGDWTTGLKISLGHIIVESVIFILIVMGLASFALPYTQAIAGIGGIALVAFGLLTIRGSSSVTMAVTGDTSASNPVVAGIVTSAANPYFWIWWLSIGGTMVITGLQGGIVLAGAFMIGHWSADTGWFTLVSASISRGKAILPDTVYRNVIAACGIVLIIFGVYYLSRIFS